MANPILDSQYASPNALLQSHGFPGSVSANTVLSSHSPGGVYPNPGVDTTPAEFSFTDQTSVALSTLTTSAAVTITGINAAATVTVSGGEWEKNSTNSWGTASGTVVNNDTVRVRHTSHASNSTAVNTTLTVGGVSDTFTSTTVASAGLTAVLNTTTGEMNISGTGFGSKTGPAPTWMKSWYGVTSGTLATNASVGFDRYEHDHPQAAMIDTDGIGGNALRYFAETPAVSNSGSSNHLQKDIPDSTEVYSCIWLKLIPDPNPPTLLLNPAQLKGTRIGKKSAVYPDDGASNYSAHPQMGLSVYIRPDGTWPTPRDATQGVRHATTAAGVDVLDGLPGDAPYNEAGVVVPNFNWATWFCFEAYYRFNTIGSSNGAHQVIINGGELWNDTTNINTRQTVADVFQYVSPTPGIQSLVATDDNVPDFYVQFSRPYIDTGSQSRRRVFLGNAPTLAGCTGKFLLNPTTWNDTTIVATEGRSRPSGYDYLYVTDDSGGVITNTGAGFAFSTV